MSTVARRFLLPAAFVLIFADCGTTHVRDPFEGANPASEQLRVLIENRGFNDVRVYALTSRGTQSLGTVGGNTQREARIDWRQSDAISFRLEVLAGRTYNTHGLSASPGDRLVLLIPDNPANATVRPR